MPVDPTGINTTISSRITSNGRGAITGAILASVLGTGGITAWAVANFADKGSIAFSIISDGGAKGDGAWKPFSVTCSAGSNTVSFSQTSGGPTPTFSADDVGKVVMVPGCGGTYWAYGKPTVVSGGSGYVYGEKITLAGGVGSTELQVIVTKTDASDTVSGGFVVDAYLYNPGVYTTIPAGTLSQDFSSKAGTGATFTVANFQSALTGTITAASGASITLNNSATAAQSGAAQTVTWGHDDAAAFNSALVNLGNNVATGNLLNIPTPTGQGYLIASPIVLPSGSSANNYATSTLLRGQGESTVIRAVSPMDAQITNAGTYNGGYEIDDITLDGGQIAVHNLNAKFPITSLRRLSFINAASGGSNVLIGAWTKLLDSKMTNTVGYSDADHLPTFNLDVESSDSHFSDTKVWNANYCNVFDISANNDHHNNHAFGFPLVLLSKYNFCAIGDSKWTSNTADTALTAGFLVGHYGAQLVGNRIQGYYAGSVNTPVGIEIVAAAQQVLVIGNRADSSVDKVIQTGGSLDGSSCVFGNVGLSHGLYFGSSEPYSSCGPFISGEGNTVLPNALGTFGDFNTVLGENSFAFGTSAYNYYRVGWIGQSNGAAAWAGDNQTAVTEMNGFGVSGAANILAGNRVGGAAPLYGTNEIQMRIDIPASMLVQVSLTSSCSTGDVASWTMQGTLTAAKSKASVDWANGTPPTFTAVGSPTAGAAGWIPASVIDATNGAAYLTVSGTCTGGKTIYSVARVTTTEVGAGVN